MSDFIEETNLEGVFIIKRPTFTDDRGFFREIFRKKDLEKRLGYKFNPVQSNHSHSKKDALRGIHIAPWHKLVTVLNGVVQQVVVDTRAESKTFGKYISVKMGGDNKVSVFIPENVGNAFLVLSEEADYFYITTDYWAAGKEKYMIYNDPDINIKWETKGPLLSEKDLTNPTLKELFPKKKI